MKFGSILHVKWACWLRTVLEYSSFPCAVQTKQVWWVTYAESEYSLNCQIIKCLACNCWYSCQFLVHFEIWIDTTDKSACWWHIAWGTTEFSISGTYKIILLSGWEYSLSIAVKAQIKWPEFSKVYYLQSTDYLNLLTTISAK